MKLDHTCLLNRSSLLDSKDALGPPRIWQSFYEIRNGVVNYYLIGFGLVPKAATPARTATRAGLSARAARIPSLMEIGPAQAKRSYSQSVSQEPLSLSGADQFAASTKWKTAGPTTSAF